MKYKSIEQYQEAINLEAMTIKSQSFVPIYIKNEETSKNEFNGTGVLLIVEKRLFLLTATHVVEHARPENINLAGKNEFVNLYPIKAGYHYTNPDEKNTDISIFELLNDLNLSLSKQYKYLTEDDLLFEKLPEELKNNFGLSGFPGTYVKKLNPKLKKPKHKATLLHIPTERSNFKLYNKLGYTSPDHLIFEFPKRSLKPIVGNEYRTMNPKGMSGGAAWYIPYQELKNGEKIQIYLIGILIENIVDGHRCIIASSGYKILNMLEEVFKVNLKYSIKEKIHLQKRMKN